ncbi:hypothetical protein [Burkholderia pseudomallei]|uniref:hypothetical protein n=1 Tax=Burkholderia pseudomallei TaxID=28450 RepID=UPI002174D9A4|nr:hypothetical protein [Burkholderia pseudomallei]
MKTCIALRAVPELRELREGLSTVDYMTAAIAHIARNPAAPGKKFNLTHSGERNLSLEDFFDRLERAFGFSFARAPVGARRLVLFFPKYRIYLIHPIA